MSEAIIESREPLSHKDGQEIMKINNELRRALFSFCNVDPTDVAEIRLMQFAARRLVGWHL